TSPPHAAPTIHFHYPKAWTLVPHSRWAALNVPPGTSAVLERRNHSGVLVVLSGRRQVDVGTTAAATAEANQLNKQFGAKYPDYAFVRAQRIVLPHAGASLVFAYDRKKQGLLHTLTIIPAGTTSFEIDTASPPGDKAVGNEIGAILRSATLSYPKN